MNIESWCTVEKMPSQDWRRAQRSHNDVSMKSTVFKEDKTFCQQSSPSQAVQEEKHKERRHYPEKCKLN